MATTTEQETFQYITNIIETLQQVEDARKQAEEALRQSNMLKRKMEAILHTTIDSLSPELKNKRKFAKLIKLHNQTCSDNHPEKNEVEE